ncbi:MAG: hypothetical protein WA347_05885 [Rhabdochlamydiaceae bacterium]|jgi:hypothetical protein
MVRISKQAKKRAVSRRRPAPPAKKTGPRKDALPQGFKLHANALEGNLATTLFIPKIK